MRYLKKLSAVLAMMLVAGQLTAQDTSSLEIDHVFVFVSPGAPEARILRDAGFLFIPDTSVHRGQGTASLSCLFENVYLELIWKQGDEDPLGLVDRAEWRATGAAPFGIGLRRVDTLSTRLPFRTWSYEAPWMKPGTAIEVASVDEGHVSDPLVFVVPPYMSYSTVVAGAGDMLRMFQTHEIGVHKLTGVRVLRPNVGVLSPVMRTLEEAGMVVYGTDSDFALELTFDTGMRGELLDLRPSIPLVIVH